VNVLNQESVVTIVPYSNVLVAVILQQENVIMGINKTLPKEKFKLILIKISI